MFVWDTFGKSEAACDVQGPTSKVGKRFWNLKDFLKTGDYNQQLIPIRKV